MADSHTLIDSQLLSSAVTSIHFTNIPTTYSHLKLFCTGPGDNNDWLGVRFNDSTSSYRQNYIETNTSYSFYAHSGSSNHISLATRFYKTDMAGTGEMTIPYYRSGFYKYVMLNSGNIYDWQGGCGVWNSTSAITKITLFADTNGMRAHGLYSLFGLD